MICNQCGAESHGDETFCRQCGNALQPAAPPGAAGGSGDLNLKITAGPGVGRSFPLEEVNRIGRGEENEIRLFDPEVSRVHAAIYRYDEGYAINDLGSANGTFVNGHRITEATWIIPGDRVQMGAVLCQVLLPGQSAVLTPDRARPATGPVARPVKSGFPDLPVPLLGALMILGVLLAAGGVVGLIILF